MKISTNHIAGWTSIAGVIGFVGIVITLQLLQTDYNPMNQLMSELAITPYGSAMLFAFLSFSISLFSLQFGLKNLGGSFMVRILLITSAGCLMGAGIFRLDNALNLHIGLVAIAFILIGLSMYLLPHRAGRLNSPFVTAFSWALGIIAVLSLALGNSILMGLAQRATAACFLIWLSLLGLKMIRI